MSSVLSLGKKRSLHTFCRWFWKKFGSRNVRKTEFLALKLREYYNLAGELTVTDLEILAIHQLGITDFEYEPSLGRASGINCVSGDVVSIRIKPVDSLVGRAFTIGHEIREVIGHIFKLQHPRFKDYPENEVETQADIFASTLMLGEKAFSGFVYESGFDPFWLCSRYHVSVRSALARIIRTLTNEPKSPPFWATIMKRTDDGRMQYVYTSGSCRYPKFGRKSRDKIPNLLFAKQGQLVPVTGILEICIHNEKPVYIDKVCGLDFRDDYCLSVVLRPLITNKGVVAYSEPSRHLIPIDCATRFRSIAPPDSD